MLKSHNFHSNTFLQVLLGVLLFSIYPGVALATQRFILSEDGSSVFDSYTSLTWQRCAVGTVWDGKGCAGVVRYFTHEQALQIARDSGGWRLPSAKELLSVYTTPGACPGYDVSIFPGSAWEWNSYKWTSTAFVPDSNYSEAVGGCLREDQALLSPQLRGIYAVVRLIK